MTQKDQGVAISLLWPVVCFEDLSGARAGCPWLWDAGRAGWDWGELTLIFKVPPQTSVIPWFSCSLVLSLLCPGVLSPRGSREGTAPLLPLAPAKGRNPFFPLGSKWGQGKGAGKSTAGMGLH